VRQAAATVETMVSTALWPLRRPAARRPDAAPATPFGPNWYAAVMGTAITANAVPLLPVRLPWLDGPATAVWALAAVLLVLLGILRLVHRLRHPAGPSALDSAATAVFYGCPPMAMLAVGAGALGPGRPLLGSSAVLLDALLWCGGTVYGLLAAAGVPYLLVTRYRVNRSQAAPTWLLPIVAPMVSAALGPALVPHLPPGQLRSTLLLACLAMFGASLVAVALMLPLIWARLVHEEALPPLLKPSLFLVLGPLGQSVTAVYNMADAAPAAIPQYAAALRAAALLYGVPVMGFALLWLAIAAAVTIRALRSGMPFGMTWWAYTFPVGTCVTGAASLAHHTGSHALSALAMALYALLLTAWAVVGTRTVRSLLAP
jgi:C4-dicarboxylate transporter/malic acid transport protein